MSINQDAIEFVDLLLGQLPQTQSLTELSTLRSKFNASDSPYIQLTQSIAKLDHDQKVESGRLAGELKQKFNQAYAQAESQLEQSQLEAQLSADRVDLSPKVVKLTPGARNPLRKLMEDFEDFFVALGWSVETGPEVEAEWYNFDSLNFAPDHPARAMQDTFYVAGAQNVYDADRVFDNPTNLVLRTHTSPVETRAMLKKGVPIYMVAPGKVFRTDELDSTHTPVFHQLEGLAIDRDLNMGHLKGTLDYLAKFMFGPKTKTRFRPSFFPFTEPSAEMDIWFEAKKGGAGWIEWLGCGMTHPNVLKSVGVDPDVYNGFAFGLGIERTLMFRHNILDMHDVVEGDVRFAGQFGIGG